MKKKGFTLVELLAVIAILAILVIMALPAVLRMFNNARKDSFTNEVNTVIRTARQKYLLSGGSETTWTNKDGHTNALDLTGNSQLQYYVKMNNEGKIIKLQVSNGDFQYNKMGLIDVAESSDVEEITDDNAIEVGGNSIVFISRANANSITIGDEVSIDTEHFYVISSDSVKTILLAKYNLLVGDVYNKNGSNWELTKSLSSSDMGYGLQSETAKGYYGRSATDRTGTVAFSGKGYWDSGECVYDGGIVSCPNTQGLKAEYANTSNVAGTTSYVSPYPYIYNGEMSTIAPSYVYNDPWGNAQNNGYTIAYYIEEYVNKLRELGGPYDIVGRLLTSNESSALSSTIKGTFSYWTGSIIDGGEISNVNPGNVYYGSYWCGNVFGVRPAIEVSTSDMPS